MSEHTNSCLLHKDEKKQVNSTSCARWIRGTLEAAAFGPGQVVLGDLTWLRVWRRGATAESSFRWSSLHALFLPPLVFLDELVEDSPAGFATPLSFLSCPSQILLMSLAPSPALRAHAVCFPSHANANANL